MEESQIGLVERDWRAQFESGWQTSGCSWTKIPSMYCAIHTPLIKGNPGKETASRLGVTLHSIPLGLTDEFQPLDQSAPRATSVQSFRKKDGDITPEKTWPARGYASRGRLRSICYLPHAISFFIPFHQPCSSTASRNHHFPSSLTASQSITTEIEASARES